MHAVWCDCVLELPSHADYMHACCLLAPTLCCRSHPMHGYDLSNPQCNTMMPQTIAHKVISESMLTQTA